MYLHTVKYGETLYSIAAEYGVPFELVAVNNGIYLPEKLPVGQSLLIVYPDIVHTVKNGETLYSVAAQYGTTVDEIYRLNLVLGGKPYIYQGQTLIISLKDKKRFEFMTGGYAYNFIERSLLDVSLPAMGALMPFTYGFGLGGELIELNDGELLAAALEHGTRPVMHLSTLTADGVFSSQLADELLSSPEAQERLMRNILTEMRLKSYYGLDVDFEYLGEKNAAKYAEFIYDMRMYLNSQGYPLMVALAPKTSDDQAGDLYAGHDYKALGGAANSVLLMTYEWGYTYGPPMAVSPLMPVSRVIEYALTRIDKSKIFLGMSNYGYDFVLPYIKGESVATSLSTVEAVRLAGEYGAEVLYDEISGAPFFYYSDGAKDHVVWYEDARSLYARFELIEKYGLKGGLYWNLMRQNPQNLALIASQNNIRRFDLF